MTVGTPGKGRGSAVPPLVRLLHGLRAAVRWLTRQFGLWPSALVATIVVICVACALLWSNEAWRPLLAALGAGAAAFLGPLPGLVTPDMRGKWLFAIAISALVTVGTWFAVRSIDDELDAARESSRQLDARITQQLTTLSTFVRDQDDDLQDELFLKTGPFYRSLFRDKRWQSILDVALPMLEVRHDNGHALYFAGEAYRHLGRYEDMRGVFMNYQAAARERPDASVGAAAACYRGPDGYCAERLNWVLHLMADDYLREASESSGELRASALNTALRYELAMLAERPDGFLSRDDAESSCTMLHVLRRELPDFDRIAPNSRALAEALEEPCTLE